VSDVQVRRVGSAYLYRWAAVEVEIDDVRQKSDDWLGYITVRYISPGVLPHLFEGNHNLSALQGRTALAKHLASRVEGVDWPRFLEEACVLTVRAERQGEPFIAVGSLAEDETRPFWLIEPVVRVGLPTILFGDGGAGKSTTALMLASTVLSGYPIADFRPAWTAPVLYLDWETDREEINDTLRALREGHGIDIPDIYYRRETAPLQQSVRQIRRFIDEHGVALAVIDSLGAACGGEPESAEVALRLFGAIRSLGCAALCVSHVTKLASNGKPFGSVYFHNAARLTFELRRHQLPEESVMHVGVYHQKANKGKRQREIGLRVDFGEDPASITYTREEIPADATELVAAMPQAERIRLVLRQATESLTADDIASLSDVSVGNVRARLSDMVKRGQVTRIDIQPVGAQRFASRYALRSHREEEYA